MAYVRGTQAPMDVEPNRPSVFDSPVQDVGDVSLMDVEESAPATQAPSFTELRLEAQGAVPGMRLPPRKEKKLEEAPKEVPSPKVEEPEAPEEAPEEPEEESTLVLRKQPALPSSRKALQHRSFSARARDYLQGRRVDGEPRPKLLERPEVLLTYAQVIFNASILVVFLYLLFCMVYTIQRDVSQKVHEYEIEYLGEIAACNAAYQANRCGTDMQAPALTEACATWQRCAARDPTVVGRARVTAETFAEILNGFVDAVAFLTQLFSLLTLSIVVGATNSTLSFFRGSATKSEPTYAPNYSAPYYAQYALPPDWEGGSHAPRLRPRRADDE